FWTTANAKTINGEGQLQALVDGKKILIIESTVRRDLQLEDAKGFDCLLNATIVEQLALMRFEQEHEKGREMFFGKGNTLISSNSGTQSRRNRKAKRKDSQVPWLSGHTESVTDEAVYKEIDDSLTKTTQANKINCLNKRIKNLENKKRSRTYKLNRLYKVGLTVRVESSNDNDDLGEDAFKQGRIKTPTISIDEVTLAQALVELNHTKPKAKAKGIIFYELEEFTAIIPKPKSQDKEVALKLQAEFDKEKRLAREKAQKEEEEANIALIET
nr:hypothetical protein [Tanacetum cinerariifolium]